MTGGYRGKIEEEEGKGKKRGKGMKADWKIWGKNIRRKGR
jgi:hypothetical protein